MIWQVAMKLDERGGDDDDVVVAGTMAVEEVVATISVPPLAVAAVVVPLFYCREARILDIWQILEHPCRE